MSFLFNKDGSGWGKGPGSSPPGNAAPSGKGGSKPDTGAAARPSSSKGGSKPQWDPVGRTPETAQIQKSSPTSSPGLIGQIYDATKDPIDFSSMPEVTATNFGGLPSVNVGNFERLNIANLPGVDNSRTSYVRDRGDLAGRIEGMIGERQGQLGQLGQQFNNLEGRYTNLEAMLGDRQDEFGGLQRALAGYRDDVGGIQDKYHLSGPGSFGDERKSIENAVYERAMNLRRADDERQEADVRNRLWQQGLAPGSEAYNEELNRLSQSRDRAMNDLSLGAVMAGAQEHERLANLLARNRAQEVGEAGGIFDRTGQTFDRGGNLFNEGLNTFGAGNNLFNAATGLFNSGGQVFGDALGGVNSIEGFNRANEAERGAEFGRDMGYRGQIFGERQAENQVANQIQRDRHAQQMAIRQQRAAEEAQRFAQEQSLRQSAIQESILGRTQPVSDLANILGTTAPGGVPVMPSYTAPQYSAPDIMGMTGSNYAARANAASARTGGMFGALGSIGGALLSDRRFKEDIREVGRLNNGLPVVAFRYKGAPHTHIGLIAQDVERVIPEAVIDVHGVKAVNYAEAVKEAA